MSGFTGLGLFYVAMASGAVGMASVLGVLSLVSVLGSRYPVVTVLLAWQVLGERLKPIQYVGVALALGGVAAIVA